ncbi:hypothetical protein LguiA_022549 [Lonicera macranthoides]
MATEQYFQEGVAETVPTERNVSSLQNWKPTSEVDESEINLTGGFDCNICLDLVHDPVVTLCGHLYCWPCIYKWIHFQTVSSDNLDKQPPQCPVCKDEVSQETLVPLYGRGQTKPSKGKAPHLGLVIPRRPPSPRCGFNTLLMSPTTAGPRPAQQLHHRDYPHEPQPYSPSRGGYDSMPLLNLGGTVAPTVGMFGEMVYARIFGNNETTLYTYPNTYDLAGINSPRVRRHVLEADKSLSRVCFFLCCSIILCLLLF